MAYKDKYTTSLHGRRIGLQAMSSVETGGSHGRVDFVVGAEDVRKDSTTETTATNLKPFGVSIISTVSSSAVFTMDPPIPGVLKTLVFNTTGTNTLYVKTSGATITSTQGTDSTVLVSSQAAAVAVTLVPISTAKWVVLSPLSSGLIRAGTST